MTITKTLCGKLHTSMIHFSCMWLIPKDVEKPKDGRYKDNQPKEDDRDETNIDS
ncbi:hypothetical protein [uncultured Clostridium sp.]|uniref:hypothetical protein n=1 Tax=uncultured Clostridium sp. TaxID=59620 RepID=UPI0028E4764B|nr:hypothetical protein [uncultured Clostridium sp.]